jgi:hypothetical protein
LTCKRGPPGRVKVGGPWTTRATYAALPATDHALMQENTTILHAGLCHACPNARWARPWICSAGVAASSEAVAGWDGMGWHVLRGRALPPPCKHHRSYPHLLLPRHALRPARSCSFTHRHRHRHRHRPRTRQALPSHTWHVDRQPDPSRSRALLLTGRR